MQWGSTLLAVRDMEKSKRFYCEMLGLTVTDDFGANVTLSGCVSLQTLESWQTFLGRDQGEMIFGHNTAELYFEEADMDGFLQRLAADPDILYVHPPKEHHWGQRVVRFYDPDRHIVEVGEEMEIVVRRFLESGMTPQEAAQRMGVSLDYIHARMPKLTQSAAGEV